MIVSQKTIKRFLKALHTSQREAKHGKRLEQDLILFIAILNLQGAISFSPMEA